MFQMPDNLNHSFAYREL